MPYSYNAYTGNGSTTQFTIGFPYIRQEHVKVYVAYVDTAYTYVNNTTVQLATAPGAGVRVEVRRITPVASVLVDFADGSTLVAADLDTSNLQHLYLEQELDDYSKQTISIDPATGLLTAANQRITNVADPVNAQDVATKAYADAQIDSALINDVIAGTGLTISDNTPTAGQITVGITNSGVGVTQIADGAVTSAKIADATIITGDLADGAVTSAKIADGTIVAGDLASDSVTTAKILNANVTTAKIADLNVTTGKIADLGVTTGKIADAAVTAAKISGGSIDSTKLDGATVVTNSEHSGSTPNDTSFFTTSASDARYFRQDSSETISSGQAWSASDSYIATTAAIDARVIDLVDDVGGFVPIANENSFPVANPDINNPDGTGTIVSIAVMSTSRTPSSGTVTIANGSGSNTVTITGCGSTVLAAGFGVLVETTSTLHTYTFHRLTPKATEVTTVASISADVTTVAGNNANVTAVAGNAANIATVGGSIANVNAVGGSIANVNSVASNLASVNSFANTYRIAASDPATSLDVGDLVFNTTASELRVYNGSVWQGGVTATGNLVSRAGDTMTGALVHPLGAAATPSITFTGDTNTGIYSPGADQVAISTGGTVRLTSSTTAISSALPIDVPLASAATPSITFTGDPNTGIYSPGADQVAVATNGVGRLFVNSSGQVGIGGTPSYPLDVNRGSAGIIANFTDGVAQTLRITTGSGFVALNNATSDAITFQSGGNERLRITSAGLVGIGVSGPANGGATLLTVRQTGGDLSSTTVTRANAQGVTIADPASSTSNYGNGVWFDSGSLLAGIASTRTTTSNWGTDLRFYTHPTTTTNADETYERMRIDPAGRVGIGTTPGATLHVAGSNSGAYIAQVIQNQNAGGYAQQIFRVGSGAGTKEAGVSYAPGIFLAIGPIANDTTTPIVFQNNNAQERARFDTSGRLLVGTSTFAQTNTYATTQKFSVAGDAASGLQLQGYSADQYGIAIDFSKSRGASVGTNTIVQNNDSLGNLYFNGYDGSAYKLAASITAQVDGTPGANDMPGRLVFSTTADGAATPTARMTIKNNGNVGIGGSGIARILEIQSSTSNINYVRLRETSGNTPTNGGSMLELFGTRSNGAPGFYGGIFGGRQNAASHNQGYLAFYVDAAGSDGTSIEEKARIDSGGRFSIGIIASPANQLQLSTDSAGKPSTNTWTIVSDERIKEEIELADLDLCYQAVKTIPLKRFKWKDEVYTEEQVRDRRKLGWIAQDVEAVFPKAVGTYEFKYNQVFEETIIPAVEEVLDDEGNVTTPAQPERIEKSELISEDVIEDCRDLNSDQLYAAMYGAIQKLMVKVETLEAEVALLKAQ